MGYGLQNSITNTEPRVQQLVIESYRETDTGPQGPAGTGFSVISDLLQPLDFPAGYVIHCVERSKTAFNERKNKKLYHKNMNGLFTFLATIAFFALIVGLINPSWVKMPSRKRVGMIYGGAWLVFFILFGITSAPTNTATGQSTSPSAAAQTSNTTAPSQPAAPLTEQQKLDNAVSSQMSSNPATGLQASYGSSQIQPDDYADDGVTRPAGSHYILITINTPGLQWSSNLFIEDTGQLTSQIFQQVFPIDPNFYDVAVQYMGPVNDQYGNTTTSQLMMYTMDRPLYEKINWSGFSTMQNDIHLCDFLRAQHNALTPDEQSNSDVGCGISVSNLQQAEASIQASNPE